MTSKYFFQSLNQVHQKRQQNHQEKLKKLGNMTGITWLLILSDSLDMTLVIDWRKNQPLAAKEKLKKRKVKLLNS